jgi:hypothetical protein
MVRVCLSLLRVPVHITVRESRHGMLAKMLILTQIATTRHVMFKRNIAIVMDLLLLCFASKIILHPALKHQSTDRRAALIHRRAALIKADRPSS